MIQQEIFTNIESIQPILKEYTERGVAYISLEQKMVVRDTYLQILPGTALNLGCDQCVAFYMMTLSSYYEREYPKFLEAHQVTTNQVEPTKPEIKFHEEELEFVTEPTPKRVPVKRAAPKKVIK
jgi:hypothetical protein